MKFLDEVEVEVAGGKGGNGCVSFRRERFIPHGGPDGGNGGRGGSIYLESTTDLNTLIEFQYRARYFAKAGENGSGRNRAGKNGEDIYLKVPNGTDIYSMDTQEYIGSLMSHGDRLEIAAGGKGGVGNHCFKSGTNRSPTEHTLGQQGKHHLLKLSLKLLADVGLVGLPNAGKSTFIGAISNARPKTADYPFTTLKPQLGVVRLEEGRHFVVADIPGLIQNASKGAGLGLRFLKHLERTRLLLHLVDIAPPDRSDPISNIQLIQQELKQYGNHLTDKPCWIVFNKLDTILHSEQAQIYHTLKDRLINELSFAEESIFGISSLQRINTVCLSQQIMRSLETN